MLHKLAWHLCWTKAHRPFGESMGVAPTCSLSEGLPSVPTNRAECLIHLATISNGRFHSFAALTLLAQVIPLSSEVCQLVRSPVVCDRVSLPFSMRWQPQNLNHTGLQTAVSKPPLWSSRWSTLAYALATHAASPVRRPTIDSGGPCEFGIRRDGQGESHAHRPQLAPKCGLNGVGEGTTQSRLYLTLVDLRNTPSCSDSLRPPPELLGVSWTCPRHATHLYVLRTLLISLTRKGTRISTTGHGDKIRGSTSS